MPKIGLCVAITHNCELSCYTAVIVSSAAMLDTSEDS